MYAPVFNKDNQRIQLFILPRSINCMKLGAMVVNSLPTLLCCDVTKLKFHLLPFSSPFSIILLSFLYCDIITRLS